MKDSAVAWVQVVSEPDGFPERCLSMWTDSSTPSGLTRCAFDAGHTGDHAHVNGQRLIVWHDGEDRPGISTIRAVSEAVKRLSGEFML